MRIGLFVAWINVFVMGGDKLKRFKVRPRGPLGPESVYAKHGE